MTLCSTQIHEADNLQDTSAEVFRNAPVGIQIICQRLREEKCIGILKEIELISNGK